MIAGIAMAVRNASRGSDSIVSADDDAPTRRGMVLPFRPLSLAFNHINYYVDMPAVSQFSEVNNLVIMLNILRFSLAFFVNRHN